MGQAHDRSSCGAEGAGGRADARTRVRAARRLPCRHSRVVDPASLLRPRGCHPRAGRGGVPRWRGLPHRALGGRARGGERHARHPVPAPRPGRARPRAHALSRPPTAGRGDRRRVPRLRNAGPARPVPRARAGAGRARDLRRHAGARHLRGRPHAGPAVGPRRRRSRMLAGGARGARSRARLLTREGLRRPGRSAGRRAARSSAATSARARPASTRARPPPPRWPRPRRP